MCKNKEYIEMQRRKKNKDSKNNNNKLMCKI